MKSHGTSVLILSVILFLGVLGWASLSRTDTNAPHTEKNTPAPTSTLEKWKVLTNTTHTLQYPPKATGEARENESIVFFMGPKQIASGRTQTELFDGYSVRIGKMDSVSEVSPEKLAVHEKENSEKNCLSYDEASVSPIKNVVVSSLPGFQYAVMNCYVDYTETILSFNGALYRISQSYVGNPVDQQEYKEITEAIVASIRFQ